MAETAISYLLEQLGDVVIEKVKFVRGVKKEVESLKVELRRMQCFLEYANRKQVEDSNVRDWISGIREAAQDAQDTIEMFLINVENAKNRGSLKTCTTFPKRMYHLQRIGGEIESIHKSLKDINEGRKRYGIQEEAAAESTRISQVELRRWLSPWGKDEHLVGIEEDVEKLLREWVLNEEKKGLSFAVLRGIGGIGKTALARKIYNHNDVVDGPFECRAWAVVSSDFRPAETMKQLILELTRKSCVHWRSPTKTSTTFYEIFARCFTNCCRAKATSLFSTMCGRRNTWNI